MKEFFLKLWAGLKGLYWKAGRLRILSTVLTLVGIAAVAFLLLVAFHLRKDYIEPYEQSYVEIEKTPDALGITKMEIPEGITSIALFGIDSREDNFEGLSDSIMVITVDAVHKNIKIISIMRDSLVEVEGHGCQKINAAYMLGGPQLAIKTLNQNFNLAITNYATVDFISMAAIIDVVGGIEAELTEKEVKYANDMIFEMVWSRGAPPDYIEAPGYQKLNGIQAVAFARIRKTATINGTNNDYGRTERQRYVMSQLFQKALDLPVSRYPQLIRIMLPFIKTSLDYEDIFYLAGILTESHLTYQDTRIPMDEAVINDDFRPQYLGSCVYYDLEYASELMNAFIFENIPFEEYMEENPIRYERWYKGAMEVPKEEPETEAEEELEGEEGGVSEADPPEEDEPLEALPEETLPEEELPEEEPDPEETLPEEDPSKEPTE